MIPYLKRDEEPLRVACDFGAIYSLHLRLPKRGRAVEPRVILKVTWDNAEAVPGAEQRSSAFEIDLARERLVALGRKGNSFSAEKLNAKWFCNWAREALLQKSPGGASGNG